MPNDDSALRALQTDFATAVSLRAQIDELNAALAAAKAEAERALRSCAARKLG